MSLETTRKACVACGVEYEGEDTICPKDGGLLAPVTEKPSLIGTVLGDRYEVLEMIGEGGMGTVYKGRHKLMKRIVAIKLLHSDLVSSPAALLRFQQEAEAASALNHPNILTVFDFGLSPDGQPYLAMDFLEGTNLAELIEQEGHLDPDRSLPILIQACSGLHHAHQKGVVHRDMKPANIMLVDLDGQPDFVKIVDFGIAKLMPQADEESRHLTQTGQIFGSPLYMSPEQCRGRDLDARTDIYSMGCVMYRTLTGQPPIVGQDMMECMYKQVHDTPPPFNEACPELGISPRLEAIAFKAMSKEPADRYLTMAEFREALEGAQKPGPGVRLSGQEMPTVDINPPADISSPTSKTGETTVAEAYNTSGSTSLSSARSQAVSPADSGNKDSPLGDTTDPNVGINLQMLMPGAKLSHNQMSMLVLLAVLGVLGIVAAIFMLIPGHGPTGGQSPNAPAPTTDSSATADGQSPPGPAMSPAFDKYFSTARDLYSRGDFPGAEKLAKQALQEASKLSATDPNKMVPLLNMMGMIRYVKGDYQGGKTDYLLALTAAKKAYGSGSAQAAITMIALGRCYMALGDNQDAEPMVEQALSILQGLPSTKPLDLADAFSGVGELDMREGKYAESINYLSQALTIRKDQEGSKSQDVAISLGNIGEAYEYDRQFDQARDSYTKALDIWQNLGGGGTAVTDLLTNLGRLCTSTGQYAEADGFFKKALAMEQQAFGPNNPNMKTTQQLYSVLQARMKKPGGRRR